MQNNQIIEGLKREVTFEASRASGPGGQHVQKTSTRVTARFLIGASTFFNEEQKNMIRQKLSLRVNKNDELMVHVETHRSQYRNKQIALKLLSQLIEQALRKPKRRKKTAPTIASVKRRLTNKTHQKEKKSWRKKFSLNND